MFGLPINKGPAPPRANLRRFLFRRVQRNDSDLVAVDLSRKGVTVKEVAQLASALEKNLSVTQLWLNRNSIGDTGLIALAQSLSHNTALKNLDLRNTLITDAGVRELAATLRHNQTLKGVLLRGNAITNVGARFLAEALLHNNTLEILSLSGNQIEEEGAKALACAIQLNGGLTSLDLFKNPIGVEGRKALSGAVDNIDHGTGITASNFADALFGMGSVLQIRLVDIEAVGKLMDSSKGLLEKDLLMCMSGTTEAPHVTFRINRREGQPKILRAVYDKGLKSAVQKAKKVTKFDHMHLIIEKVGLVVGTDGIFCVLRERADLFEQ